MNQQRAAGLTALGLICVCTAGTGQADTDHGVDTQFGNTLVPMAGSVYWLPQTYLSYLHAGTLRSPSGFLYPYPTLLPDTHKTDNGWEYSGQLQAGLLQFGGNTNNMLFQQYSDWHDGLVLDQFSMDLFKPQTGQWLDFDASRISDDNQFYLLRGGEYGSYKFQAFYRDIPHILSTNAKPIWNGVGTETLTLPSQLPLGGSTPDQVNAYQQSLPNQTLKITRSRKGIGGEANVSPKWQAYADFTEEDRNGARPWGGPMFFSFLGPGFGGVLETVKPIDYTTYDVSAGLRYFGKTYRLSFAYTGSFFRDHNQRMTYQDPFTLASLLPASALPAGATAPNTGQFAMEPDNDYHNLRVDFVKPLAKGEFTATGAVGTMLQNDALIPPVDCTGTITFNCANWNTTAALSRRTAKAEIDTYLFHAQLTQRASDKLSWRMGVRYYQEHNRTDYTAYNPLTGDYGYIAENGAQGYSTLENGYWNKGAQQGYVTQVRNVPFEYRDSVLTLGSDYHIDQGNSLSATLTADYYQPKHRERTWVDDNRLNLSWNNHSFDWATLRLVYEFARRVGGDYDPNPYYQNYFSVGLPGFVPAPVTAGCTNCTPGAYPWTVDEERKYDLSNRTEHLVRAVATFPIGETMTLSTSIHGTYDNYGARIGRQGSYNTGFLGSWDYQPTPLTSASLSLGYDTSRLALANNGDAIVNTTAVGSSGALGGPNYPLANGWWASDHERNENLTLTLAHEMGRLKLDGSYSFNYSRGITDYSYTTGSALATATGDPANDAMLAAAAGNALPPMSYRTNEVDLGATYWLTRQLTLRLFDRYTCGTISDWHYTGFNQTRVYDNKVYTDGGPEDYSVNLVGLMLDLKL